MPTYEYACSACGSEWEQTQRITEPPVEVCPKCAKPTAHRLISAGTNFILKGGGWYSDLYASPKGEKTEKAEKSPAAEATPAGGKPAASDAKGSAAGKPTSSDATSTPSAAPSTAAPGSSS